MDRPGVLVCAMADDSLYTTDIYAWAMAQARALRDPSRRANAIDWDNADLAKPYSRADHRLLADLAAREETPPFDLPPDNP
jgi:hypothetical protein